MGRQISTIKRVIVGIAAASLVLGVAGCGASLSEPSAEEPASFYAGNDLEIIIPSSTGGGTDAQGRFFAEFLDDYVPGNPNVFVTNVEGTGGVAGGNVFHNRDDHDSTAPLLFSSASYVFPWIFGEPALELDYSDLVGVAVSPTGAVVYVNSETGITGTEDFVNRAKAGDVAFTAGDSVATGLPLLFLLAYDMLDLDVNVVFGFEGAGPKRIAFERGELDLNWDTTTSVLSDVADLEERGIAVPVFAVGQIEDGTLVRDPIFPDLPHFGEVYEMIHGEAPAGELYDAFKALALPGLTAQKVMWLHQDAPAEAVAEVRDAFEEMVGDPEFIEAQETVLGEYDLIVGDEVDAATQDLLDFPDSTREFLIDYLVENYDYQDPR